MSETDARMRDDHLRMIESETQGLSMSTKVPVSASELLSLLAEVRAHRKILDDCPFGFHTVDGITKVLASRALTEEEFTAWVRAIWNEKEKRRV